MADLIDRLSGASLGMEPSRPKLPVHQFIGCYRLYVSGIITRTEIANAWDLQGNETTQATSIANAVDAEVGVASKIAYVLRVEAVSFLIEYDADMIYHNPDGTVNKSKVATDLGILP